MPPCVRHATLRRLCRPPSRRRAVCCRLHHCRGVRLCRLPDCLRRTRCLLPRRLHQAAGVPQPAGCRFPSSRKLRGALGSLLHGGALLSPHALRALLGLLASPLHLLRQRRVALCQGGRGRLDSVVH